MSHSFFVKARKFVINIIQRHEPVKPKHGKF